MKSWLTKKVLIAKVHNFNLLSHLPPIFQNSMEVKYLGGLKVALHFATSPKATKFLEDDSTWKSWFSWISHGDKVNINYERLAWLKFSWISHGDKVNIIDPNDSISDKKDLSIGKVG